jgi:two-component system nitrate/nitrite response regulator NarL
VLLDVADDALIAAASQAGAGGYIDSSIDVSHLLRELQDAANGDIALSKSLARLMASMLKRGNAGGAPGSRMMLEAPTPHERKVLELLSGGLTNRVIARQLMLSESTVRAHVRAISEKLGAQNRVQAVARAIALGIISQSNITEE